MSDCPECGTPCQWCERLDELEQEVLRSRDALHDAWPYVVKAAALQRRDGVAEAAEVLYKMQRSLESVQSEQV